MRKDLLVVAFVGLIIALLISGTKIQSVEEYYLTHIDEITDDSETVTLTIRSDTVLDQLDKLKPELLPYVEEDGTILEETEYVLRPGDTVFEILNRATRHHRIQMEYQGADMNIYNSVYVQGIQYLYEFSCGPLSGWMYEVNGEFPNHGVSQYILHDGDDIAFYYTCDLGRDIGYEGF
ncbi:MAG: DUF4430 domain-containing protein [Solibacillus sp.]